MRISIQLIKCHTLQTVPCIVITVETQKYFFNLYESFQRVYKEHLVRFTKGSKIFLSQLSADHINGLIGLILTSEEQGLADSAQIYGPPGFVSYIESIRFLIGNRGLAFSMYDFFNDNKKLLGIKSAEYENHLLSRKDYKQLFFRLHDFLTQEQKSNPTVINDAESFIIGGLYYKDEYMEIHPLLLAQESRDQDIKPSLCYILKSKKIAGKVNAEKLKANNIAPKYIGKLLEQGEIEIDGKKYFAKDFRDPESPVVVIVVIDCPTEAHMESLLSQNRLKELFSGEIDENEQEMKAVVHIVPGRILCNPKYKEFVGKFPGSCHHLFTSGDLKETKVEFTTEEVKEDKKEKGKKNKESKAAVIETVPRGQQNNRSFLLTNVLSQYFPDHFPRLDDLLTTSKYSLDDLFPTLIKKSAYEKMVELVVSPKRIEGFSPILYPMDKVARLINFKENEKFTKKYKKLTSKAKESNPADEMVLTLFKNCDPEVVFLGVQAMMPSVYCNTSGIYLRFWQQNNIGFLLDCGEGSYIQILQHYGPEKAREMIKNLRVIYITHIHADHHLGFLQLIRERDRIYEEDRTVGSPLFLVVPLNCGAWVAKYCKAIDNLKFKVVFSQHIRIETSKADPELDMAHATGGILLQERKHGEEEAKIESEPSSVVEENKIEEDAGEHHGSYNDPDSYAYLVEQEQRSRENLELFHEFLSSELGITRLRAVDVDHCPLAQGIYIEHKDGWKFVYTGDTAPCDVTVEEVGNTTILVHESTFGEDLKDMAKERKHATDKEAMEIGMKMKAWRTVLTHFSQRYLSGLNRQSTKEQLGEMRGYEKENVVRAWDHFSFRFSQMKDLPLLSRCVSNIVESL